MNDALQADSCARKLRALAEPERLRIVQCLRDGPHNVGELAALLNSEVVNVSHHLGVLRQAGLVKADGVGREQRYQLDAEPLARLQLDWFMQFTHLSEIALSALKRQVESAPGRDSKTRRRRRSGQA